MVNISVDLTNVYSSELYIVSDLPPCNDRHNAKSTHGQTPRSENEIHVPYGRICKFERSDKADKERMFLFGTPHLLPTCDFLKWPSLPTWTVAAIQSPWTEEPMADCVMYINTGSYGDLVLKKKKKHHGNRVGIVKKNYVYIHFLT